ncbi:hypothetical protein KBD69_02465 [Candidatus Woesebacteria bacterium]|nr:hypothetical protein [Candidatus Woesebacteria bacterium]
MYIEYKNPYKSKPLQVSKREDTSLENVTEEVDIPALVFHFPSNPSEVAHLIQQVNTAIAARESCQLIIPEAKVLIPDGLKIESAIAFHEEAIELLVIIPGEQYLALYINNLIQFRQ